MNQPATPRMKASGLANKRQLIVNANYETFTFVLSVLQLANSILWLVLPSDQAQVVVGMSLFISMFLVMDLAFRLRRARRTRGSMGVGRGWLLLLGSLPLPLFALFRLLWYWLTLRSLRRGDFSEISYVVTRQRARTSLLFVLLMTILVTEFGSILILRAEARHAGANIETAGDAVWWLLVTIATVGYGDTFPVTSAGRIVGVCVLIAGVGLFTVLTSFLAQWFLRARPPALSEPEFARAPAVDYSELLKRIDELAQKVEVHGVNHREGLNELRSKLEDIEDRLPR